MADNEKLPRIYRPVIVDQPVQELFNVVQQEGLELPRSQPRLDILTGTEMMALNDLSGLALKGLKVVLRQEMPESFHTGLLVFVNGMRPPRRSKQNLLLHIQPTQELEDERRAVLKIIKDRTDITIPEYQFFKWRVPHGSLVRRQTKLMPMDEARLQVHRPDLLNLTAGVID